jgi:hypothetical protein
VHAFGVEQPGRGLQQAAAGGAGDGHATTADAQRFVEDWLRVWHDRDGHAYADLLHEECVFDNPMGPITREQLPQFVDSLLAIWPDHRIEATRWEQPPTAC